MLSLSGLLTDAPRSLYPPPQGLARQANCQLVADDGRNWLLCDPTGHLVQLAGQRVAVAGHTDGNGLLVLAATPAPIAATAAPQQLADGQVVLTGTVMPVVAAPEPGPAAAAALLEPRHQLTGQHGTVWLLAPHTDLDGLSGNAVQAAGWLIQPQQMLAATAVRLLPAALSA